MPRARPALVALLIGSVSIVTSAPATTAGTPQRGKVTLVAPFEIVPAAGVPRSMARTFETLAAIDPNHPSADENGQTLSLFGREDLIAAASGDYQPTRCAPAGPQNVFAEIERRARTTRIVIVNESHERSQHRGFTAELARRLRPLGFDTLAMEALTNNPPGTPERYRPTFLKEPNLPYLTDDDGHYLSEAGFGRLGRQAKALGYRLLPYEFTENGPPLDLPRDQRIALREEGQARNLATYLHDHPHAKLLVHVGYSHAAKVAHADGATWMAARLKQKAGIDPLTISQTTCRGGSNAMRLATLPPDQPRGTFDLLVDHPRARFVRGRPAWRMRAGDRPVTIPRVLRPATGWRIVEARPVSEPVTSVPMDRVAIRPGEDVALMLPPGRYRVRAIDAARQPQQLVRLLD